MQIKPPGSILMMGKANDLISFFRYASSFDNALEEAVVSAPEVRQLKMSTLAKSLAAGEAHPTLEHLLPIYICAGAAGKDTGKRLWTFAEGSLNWAQYRFG